MALLRRGPAELGLTRASWDWVVVEVGVAGPGEDESPDSRDKVSTMVARSDAVESWWW